MKTLYNTVSTRFEDGRHVAMSDGARAAGFHVVNGPVSSPPKAGDVALYWNLHGAREDEAARFRAGGGSVIVAEEGYTRYLVAESHFAFALDGHNGSGRWFPRGGERWAAFGVPLAPWRRSGGHILVCGQRSIGGRAMASPRGWHDDVARRLRERTKRLIVVRPHPGKNKKAAPDLDSQLRDAWAVVVWSSACAVRALLRGIPVFYEAPHHVLAPAMTRGIDKIDDPPLPDRLPAFEAMAWAQCSLAELRTGAPFRHLLQR